MPSYLFNLISQSNHNYNTRHYDNIESFYCRTDVFKNVFFPYVIDEWNKLKIEIGNVESFPKFRKLLLNLNNGSPSCRPIHNIFNPLGVKYITRLRIDLSHLNERRFNHNFHDCMNPLCSCGNDTESNYHFFLHCRHFTSLRAELISNLKMIDENLLRLSDDCLTNLILFGDPNYSPDDNRRILNASISFILRSERFKSSLI